MAKTLPAHTPPTSIDRKADGVVWRKGLTLDDASWAFAPSAMRRRYADAADPRHMERFNENIRNVSAVDLNAQPNLMTALPADLIRLVLAPPRVRAEMRTWLGDQLSKGVFPAYGDGTPINLDNPPRLIPPEYFKYGNIVWAESALKIGQTGFVAIKVFRPSWIKDISVELPKLPRKIGRPSRKVEIERAISVLLSEGVSAAELHSKKGFARIRQKAKSMAQRSFPGREDAGLKDQVIKRVLVELVRSRKL